MGILLVNLISCLIHYFPDKCYFEFQGRPKGVTPKYSLKPLVPRLSELLGVEVCSDLQVLQPVSRCFILFSSCFSHIDCYGSVL
jgi:hypothetical protein